MRKRTDAPAFTLLEIMLAVAVLAMVTVSIYRFVDTTIAGVRMSQEHDEGRSLEDAFERFVRDQFNALPPIASAIAGEPHQFDGQPSDEVTWIARPGFGAFTRHAAGETRVTLTVQESKTNGPLEIGLRRQDIGATQEAVWTPLLGGVRAFSIQYYDRNSSQWLDKWTEPLHRPAMVQLRYWRGEVKEPIYMIVNLPEVLPEVVSGQLQQQGNRGARGGRGGRDGRQNRQRPSPDGEAAPPRSDRQRGGDQRPPMPPTGHRNTP